MKLIPRTSLFILLAASFFSLSAQAKPWKGAELITRDTFKYGAVEARIRGPEGSGMLTAFFYWKDGSELDWTEWQEQDIEMFGKDGRFQTQIMTPGDPRTAHSVRHGVSSNIYDHYYTYRMEWTPEQLAFYVDGNLIRVETNREEYGKLLEPNRAEAAQIRINIWAGDWSWSGAFDESAAPAYTYVDYLQVFDYTPGQGPNQSDFSLRWRDDFNYIDTGRWWFANWTFSRAINDFIPQNATTIDGKLVMGLTSESQIGQFPATAPADNPIQPPTDEPVKTSLPADIEPFVTPARIEAEDFQAYVDRDEGNNGDEACDTGDVDAQYTSDIDGFCNLAWTRSGERVTYWVRIADSEMFTFRIRAATAREDVAFHVEVDGEDISGPLTVDALGWQTFQNIEFETAMVDGIREVSLVFDTGSVNVNYFIIDNVENPEYPNSEPPTTEPPSDDAFTLPGRLEAEAFVDFLDMTEGNTGPAYCGDGDVDMQPTEDVDGDCNIGWTDPGEYTEYAVVSPEDATYLLSLRIASGANDRRVRLEVDGEQLPVVIDVPSDGWQVYSDVSTEISLSEGEHRVRVIYENGRTNFNYMVWTQM